MNTNYVPPFDQVIERLRIAMKLDNVGQIADALEIKRNAFYNRKTAGSLPYEHIIRVCLRDGMSVDWVFTGEGTPFKNTEEWVAPVAEIEPGLMAEIAGELTRAFEGEEDKERLVTAAQRGALAAQIFNKVAFVKAEKVRSAMIRDQARMFAEAAKWLQKSP